MIELPASWRVLLVQSLDEFCADLDDTDDTDAIAESVIEIIEDTAAEVSSIDAEDLLPSIEAELEDHDSLAEALSERFQEDDDDFDWTGELIVRQLEKVVELEYADHGGADGDVGFFEDETGAEFVGEDEDDF